MIINKNHKNTTQFSWATPYAANACISECSSKLGTSALQASSALLTKQENFVEKPSALRLKNRVAGFPLIRAFCLSAQPILRGFRYAYGMNNFFLLRGNEDSCSEEKKWFFKRNALGFSDCVLLASQEALYGLGWAWKVYFSKHKMSQTAQGAALTKQKRGFLGFCLPQSLVPNP